MSEIFHDLGVGLSAFLVAIASIYSYLHPEKALNYTSEIASSLKEAYASMNSIKDEYKLQLLDFAKEEEPNLFQLSNYDKIVNLLRVLPSAKQLELEPMASTKNEPTGFNLHGGQPGMSLKLGGSQKYEIGKYVGAYLPSEVLSKTAKKMSLAKTAEERRTILYDALRVKLQK